MRRTVQPPPASRTPKARTARREAERHAGAAPHRDAEREHLLAQLEAERQRLAVHYGVVSVLAEAHTLKAAAPKILQAVCENIGWDVGEIWLLDRPAQVLRNAGLWCRPGVEPRQFFKATRGLALAKGQSLPGTVWRTGRRFWTADVTQVPGFTHADPATQNDLRAAFAFPIRVRREIIGVIEFFNRAVLEPDAALLRTVTAISRQIGQFLLRLEAEEALRQANRQLEKRVRQRTAALGQANRDLWAENAERQRLESEVLEVSEQERRRFGQDLHDDICQQLSGLAMMNSTLAARLRRIHPAEAAKADRLAALLGETLGHTRALARGLHPVELDAKGLMSALHELAETTARKVPCRLACRSPVLIADNKAALQLYRIAQEAVTNALKHAGARQIVIGLGHQRGRIVLSVEDDGAGLSKKESKGMGLHIMAYRARTIGATLRLRGGQPQGTRIICSCRPAP